MPSTRCSKGHAWKLHTYIDPRGKRQCRACRRIASQHFRHWSPKYRRLHTRRLPWPDRFWIKVDKQDDCWLWCGAINQDGYGVYSGRVAHRIAFKLVRGDIPAGTEIDHLCRRRNCVNPAHLDPVTHAVNIVRGDYSTVDRTRLGRIQREKTHCPQGHPYTGDNLKIGWRGARVCRICEREKSRRYLDKKRRERT